MPRIYVYITGIILSACETPQLLSNEDIEPIERDFQSIEDLLVDVEDQSQIDFSQQLDMDLILTDMDPIADMTPSDMEFTEIVLDQDPSNGLF